MVDHLKLKQPIHSPENWHASCLCESAINHSRCTELSGGEARFRFVRRCIRQTGNFMVNTATQPVANHLPADTTVEAASRFDSVDSSRELDIAAFDTSQPRDEQSDSVLRSGDRTVMIVADGFENKQVEEIAIDTVMNVLDRVLAANSDSLTPNELRSSINRALSEANAKIVQQARQSAQKSSRCSIVVAAQVASYVIVKAVGDCRAYLMRNGHLTQLTQDHTLTHLLTSSGPVPEQVLTSGRNVLLNCLGLHDFQPNAEFAKFELSKHDRLLLTNRGLTAFLTDADIRATLSRSTSAHNASTALGHDAVNHGATQVKFLTTFVE